MLEINESEILSKSIYTILKIEGLFKKSDFHERYAKQLFRIGEQFNNLRRKENITSNHLEEYLKWNNEKIPNFPMTKYEGLIEITTMLCSFGLTHYEFLKRFFIETLYLNKLRDKKGREIGTTPTYGRLVEAFQTLPNFNTKMEELLDIDLRNALAHDTWYVEKKQIRYINWKNEIIKIPIEKFPQKISIISIAYTTITNNYFGDFFPEVIKWYEEGGNKKANEIFPLYGMNED